MTEEKQIKDYVLKIKGKVSLLEPVELDNNYHLEIEGSIESVKDKSEHDGTYIRYYELEPIVVNLITNIGKTIKAKDPRSWSQKFRAKIKFQYDNSNVPYEFDSVYETIYKYLIAHSDELFNLAIKKLQND